MPWHGAGELLVFVSGQKLVMVACEYKAVEISGGPLSYRAEHLLPSIHLDSVLVSPEMLVLQPPLTVHNHKLLYMSQSLKQKYTLCCACGVF